MGWQIPSLLLNNLLASVVASGQGTGVRFATAQNAEALTRRNPEEV